LDIEHGECLCLSGSSGAGKTLLLRAIADLDPHDGEVYLDGVPSTQIAPPQWRRKVALLAADSQWWGLQVGEHFCRQDPEGLESLGFSGDTLNWSVERLSSGERQRLALLRLLCNRPSVLLLDEPTANLDPESTQRVERLVALYRERERAAVLWVSHSREQARRVADRSVILLDGRLEDDAQWN
jgi:ABC-type iron transport system FetAB ATPase subunit